MHCVVIDDVSDGGKLFSSSVCGGANVARLCEARCRNFPDGGELFSGDHRDMLRVCSPTRVMWENLKTVRAVC